MEQTKKTAEAKKQALENLQEKELKLIELKRDYRKHKERIDSIAGLFPKTKDISSYITQLEQLTFNTNTRLTSLKVGGEEQRRTRTTQKINPDLTQMLQEGNMYKLPIEMTIKSPNINESFSNIQKLVETIEKLSRYTSITKVSIKNTGNNVLEASISLNIYVNQ